MVIPSCTVHYTPCYSMLLHVHHGIPLYSGYHPFMCHHPYIHHIILFFFTRARIYIGIPLPRSREHPIQDLLWRVLAPITPYTLCVPLLAGGTPHYMMVRAQDAPRGLSVRIILSCTVHYTPCYSMLLHVHHGIPSLPSGYHPIMGHHPQPHIL